MIASVIYDSRCWMSDVAFRTGPPTGGPSCANFFVYVFFKKTNRTFGRLCKLKSAEDLSQRWLIDVMHFVDILFNKSGR